jgi:hypothetical protein
VGPARFEYRLDREGKIELNSDGTVSVEWWLRDESGKWEPWMSNTFTKVDG